MKINLKKKYMLLYIRTKTCIYVFLCTLKLPTHWNILHADTLYGTDEHFRLRNKGSAVTEPIKSSVFYLTDY